MIAIDEMTDRVSVAAELGLGKHFSHASSAMVVLWSLPRPVRQFIVNIPLQSKVTALGICRFQAPIRRYLPKKLPAQVMALRSGIAASRCSPFVLFVKKKVITVDEAGAACALWGSIQAFATLDGG